MLHVDRDQVDRVFFIGLPRTRWSADSLGAGRPRWVVPSGGAKDPLMQIHVRDASLSKTTKNTGPAREGEWSTKPRRIVSPGRMPASTFPATLYTSTITNTNPFATRYNPSLRLASKPKQKSRKGSYLV
jgi:hypothetical protein